MYRRDIYEQDTKASVYPDRSNRIVLSTADSFTFCYRYFDMAVDRTNLSLGDLNICIKYFIKGKSGEYYVKKVGTDLLNCILIDDQKLMKAIMEHTQLDEGDLFAEFNLFWTNPEFASRCAISQYVVDTKVTLVDPKALQELNLDKVNVNNAWIGFDEHTGEVYGVNIPESSIENGMSVSGEVYSIIKS